MVQAQNENHHPIFKILEPMYKLQSFVIKIYTFKWVYGVSLMVPINQNKETIHVLLSSYWRKKVHLLFYASSKQKKKKRKNLIENNQNYVHWKWFTG